MNKLIKDCSTILYSHFNIMIRKNAIALMRGSIQKDSNIKAFRRRLHNKENKRGAITFDSF